MEPETKQRGEGGWAGSGLVTVPLSLLALVLIWAVASAFMSAELLPPPLTVLALAGEEWRSGELLFHLGATLARVLAAFILAMAIGAAIGIALGLSGRANRAFDPWLIVALNVPALVTIVLCYLWFGLTEPPLSPPSPSTRSPTWR